MKRHVLRLVALGLAVALSVGGCAVFGGGSDAATYTGVFDDGTGLFPSAPVRVRGVDVGQITDIRTRDGLVQVDFTVDGDVEFPTDSLVLIIPLTLLGERYLQILPGDSPVEFAAGDTVPIEQTGKPAELDELLQGLEDFVAAVDEEKARELLVNLAEVLDGNGTEINELIANGAQTIDILADESDDLNTIVSAFATLNETIAARSATLQDLVRNYNSLSSVLVANQGALSSTIDNLDRSLFELARLLIENEDELTRSFETLTQVGRTLDRNHEVLADLLEYTVDLFAAADLAYNRENNWLPLNNQGSGPTFGNFIADRLASRFQGICVRIVANFPGPHPAPVVDCAAGDDAIFGELFDALPDLIDELSNQGFGTADANEGATQATILTGLARIFELVPDLSPESAARLEQLSADDDRILLDLIAANAPEDLPAAVRALLDELAAADGAERADASSASLPPLPPAPAKKSLDQVYESLEVGS